MMFLNVSFIFDIIEVWNEKQKFGKPTVCFKYCSMIRALKIRFDDHFKMLMLSEKMEVMFDDFWGLLIIFEKCVCVVRSFLL